MTRAPQSTTRSHSTPPFPNLKIFSCTVIPSALLKAYIHDSSAPSRAIHTVYSGLRFPSFGTLTSFFSSLFLVLSFKPTDCPCISNGPPFLLFIRPRSQSVLFFFLILFFSFRWLCKKPNFPSPVFAHVPYLRSPLHPACSYRTASLFPPPLFNQSQPKDPFPSISLVLSFCGLRTVPSRRTEVFSLFPSRLLATLFLLLLPYVPP